jgi:hypothetical protein
MRIKRYMHFRVECEGVGVVWVGRMGQERNFIQVCIYPHTKIPKENLRM